MEASTLKVVFNTNKMILEKLIIVEEICVKLIFSRCVGLNWGDYYGLKVTYTANHKYNMIEVEEKNPNTKAKQLKNKKQ